MNEPIIIRPYDPTDLDVVIAIFQRAVRETAAKDYNEAQIQAPDGHLDMLFVHPAWNGKGVASALLQVVVDTARQQNLQRIFTEASVTARPFFERRGFQVITEQVVETRGQWLTNFRMEKWLKQQ